MDARERRSDLRQPGRADWTPGVGGEHPEGEYGLSAPLPPAPELAVHGWATPVRAARALESGDPVPFARDGTTLTLNLPPTRLLPQVIVLECDETPQFQDEGPRQRLDGTVVLTANQAGLHTTHDGRHTCLVSLPRRLGRENYGLETPGRRRGVDLPARLTRALPPCAALQQSRVAQLLRATPGDDGGRTNAARQRADERTAMGALTATRW